MTPWQYYEYHQKLGLPEAELAGLRLRAEASGPPPAARQSVSPETQASTSLRPPGKDGSSASGGQRTLRLTSADTIRVRPVRWAWEGRVALGSLALLAGREGIGKSTLAYQLAADVTRGVMPGVYAGTPKAVIVAATEDSWEHTIVPRLMAAGADLARVYRVDVTTSEGVDTGLSLPRDLTALERQVAEVDAALILLDPLMSRLAANLDTHKDAEVRLALEPLVRLADKSGATVLGLIHLNKSTSNDPLTMVMGSRAFAAVARAVLFVMRDPEDESVRLMAQPKNNLGRTDLPTLTYKIVSATVAETEEGPVITGKVEWLGETDRSLTDALEAASGDGESRTAAGEAADWLSDYLTSQGGSAGYAVIQSEGRKAGHSESALKRARARLKVVSSGVGFPRRTFWTLPAQSGQPVRSTSGETELTELTDLTGDSDASEVSQVTLQRPDPTALPDCPHGNPPGTCLACLSQIRAAS